MRDPEIHYKRIDYFKAMSLVELRTVVLKQPITRDQCLGRLIDLDSLLEGSGESMLFKPEVYIRYNMCFIL